MVRMRTAALALIPLVLAGPAWGIALNQADDFEDGTTLGWKEGSNTPSPNPPINVSSGGPLGDDDAYMRLVSSGGQNAGSRMTVYNQSQWRGDYPGAGVVAIRFDAKAFSGTGHLRVAIDRNGCRWSSTTAAVIPPDGLWHSVTLPLDQMTRVEGTCQLTSALGSVAFLRIVSSTAPAWRGDAVAMTLGVDNITALGTVEPVEPVTWSRIKTRY